MKKIAFSIVLFSIGFQNLSAQKKTVFKKNAFGFSISPHAASVFVKSSDPDDNKTFRTFYSAFDGHVFFQKKINGHESFEFGFGLTQQGFKETDIFMDKAGNLIENAYFLDKIYHFQIPLRYNTRIFQGGKFRTEFMIGLNLNLLLIYKPTIESPIPVTSWNNRLGKTSNENFSATGGFNLIYELTDTYAIRCSPYIQGFLKPLTVGKASLYFIDSGIQLAVFKRI
jgi:hypothetical protein